MKGVAMSAINNSSTNPIVVAYSRTARASESKARDRVSRYDKEGDSVEISDEARNKLVSEYSADGLVSDYGSIFETEKTMVPGSKEQKKFKELLEKVKSLKSEITSQIEDVLERSGLSPAAVGKMKIEVDRSGKIVVGGIENEKALRAVENALNREKGLGKKILQYQGEEKNLSQEVKSYTGASLYELTQTWKGDVSERIFDAVEANRPAGQAKYLNADYYGRLGFLGTTRDTVLSTDDVGALSFGDIDFSGEISVMAEPEKSIKDSLQGVCDAIQSAFDSLNGELIERMRAAGVSADDERAARSLLSLDNISITVDSDGGIRIEGMLADDEAAHKAGLELVEKLVREMLSSTSDNSYHVNTFLASSRNLADRHGAALGGDAGKHVRVVGEIRGGAVGGIRLDSARALNSYQQGLLDSINRSMAHVIRAPGTALG